MKWFSRFRRKRHEKEEALEPIPPEVAEQLEAADEDGQPESDEPSEQNDAVESSEAEPTEAEEKLEEVEEASPDEAPESIVAVEAPADATGTNGTADTTVIASDEPSQPEPEPEPENEPERKRMGMFARLRAGLGRTRENLSSKVASLVQGRKAVTEEMYEELEDVLIQADIGVPTTLQIVDGVRERFRREKNASPDDLPQFVIDEMKEVLGTSSEPFVQPGDDGPRLYMVVGVNGAGKTTTIGKLAARFTAEGKSVLLGAGDTFRAAAIDQLAVWAERAGADMIRHQEGGDPAAVAYDTIQAARSRGSDVVILDTAGRLQSKVNLMRELSKVYRVVEREWGRPPDELLLVIDATTGQNGLSQAKLFHEAVPLTGVVLTKLDGTAKGGIVLAIASELKLPVKLIGIGEAVDDLRDFDPDDFLRAIAPS